MDSADTPAKKQPNCESIIPAPPMRLITRTDTGVLLVIVAGVVVLILASVLLGDQIKIHIASIQAWIDALGPSGIIVFVALLIVGTSLLLPGSIFGVAAGVLFGLAWGMVIAVTANVLAATFQYALSRWWFRQRVQRAVDRRPSFVAIQRAVMKDQLWLQFLLRLTPLNPASISYLLGATGVRFSTFAIACAGLLPHVCLEVYLGHAGEHLVEASATSDQALSGERLLLIAGLVLGVVAIIVISAIARKAVLRTVADDESA